MFPIDRLYSLTRVFLANASLSAIHRELIADALEKRTLGALLRHERILRERITEKDFKALRRLVRTLEPGQELGLTRLWTAGTNGIVSPQALWGEKEFLKRFDDEAITEAIRAGRAREAALGPDLYCTATTFSRHHTVIQAVKHLLQSQGRRPRDIAVVGAGWKEKLDETYEVFEWAAVFRTRTVAFDANSAVPRLVRQRTAHITVHPAYPEAFQDYDDYLKAFGTSIAELKRSGLRFSVPTPILERISACHRRFLTDPFPLSQFDVIAHLRTFFYLGGPKVSAPRDPSAQLFLLELFSSLKQKGGLLVMDTPSTPIFSDNELSLLGMIRWQAHHLVLDVERRVPVPSSFTFYQRLKPSERLTSLGQKIRQAYLEAASS